MNYELPLRQNEVYSITVTDSRFMQKALLVIGLEWQQEQFISSYLKVSGSHIKEICEKDNKTRVVNYEWIGELALFSKLRFSSYTNTWIYMTHDISHDVCTRSLHCNWPSYLQAPLFLLKMFLEGKKVLLVFVCE